MLCFCIAHSNALGNEDLDEEIYDPFQKWNRAAFAFNKKLDNKILIPIAQTYQKAVPKGVRRGLYSFLDNVLYSPVTVLNNLLQFKIKEAFEGFWYFAFNSLVGMGGFNNVSKEFGLRIKHKTFGSTLAYYGAPAGPYFMIPILGPTTFRDMWDLVLLDKYTNPISSYLPAKYYFSLNAGYRLVLRAAVLGTDSHLMGSSTDQYIAIRSMYYQRRKSMVKSRAPWLNKKTRGARKRLTSK